MTRLAWSCLLLLAVGCARGAPPPHVPSQAFARCGPYALYEVNTHGTEGGLLLECNDRDAASPTEIVLRLEPHRTVWIVNDGETRHVLGHRGLHVTWRAQTEHVETLRFAFLRGDGAGVRSVPVTGLRAHGARFSAARAVSCDVTPCVEGSIAVSSPGHRERMTLALYDQF